MPKNKKAWCSWNSSIKKDEIEKNSITYWLNLLQNLKCKENIFLTLNPHFEINESKILKKVRFTHPYFCLLYTSPSPRDRTRSRMPSSA